MNDQTKKTLLRQIPYGLFVVTMRSGDDVGGFTATWMMQCSFAPPMLALAIKADSRARELVAPGTDLVVHYLSKDQTETAKVFFQTPPAENGRFGDIEFQENPRGVPVLDDAIAHIECTVRSISEDGDHHVVTAEITGVAQKKAVDPLVLRDTPWNYGG